MNAIPCLGGPVVVGLLSILAATVVGPAPSAAPLGAAAGDRVMANAPAVAAELQDAITDGRTDAAADLRRIVDTDDPFRVYHRDHEVLVAMTARRNLLAGDKRSWERQAAAIARGVLQEKFSHLLETEDGFQGLDASAVRVVIVEPDAFEDCPGRRPTRSGGAAGDASPTPFGRAGLWSHGWATPAPCAACQ